MGVLRWYSRNGTDHLIEDGTAQAEYAASEPGFVHVDPPDGWKPPEGYEVENPEPEAPKSRAKAKG